MLRAKEENLLDLAADASLPRERLRELGRERETAREQLNAVAADLTTGRNLIDSFLELLTDIRTLYIASSDDIRRSLIQAVFNNLNVANDDVIGDDVKQPL